MYGGVGGVEPRGFPLSRLQNSARPTGFGGLGPLHLKLKLWRLWLVSGFEPFCECFPTIRAQNPPFLLSYYGLPNSLAGFWRMLLILRG